MATPPPAPESAAAPYRREQAAAAAAAAVAAAAAWRMINGKNLDMSWPHVLARLLPLVAAAQRKAAAAAPAYIRDLLAVQGTQPQGTVRLSAGAFAGVTGDGRPLGSLLYTPVARSKHLIGSGVRISAALAQEELHLVMLVRTQVADAGRMAVQAQMAAEPAIRGYVRQVHLPACARCIILAGRFYRYSSGFLRHPDCDCTMIPAVGQNWVHSQDPAELMAAMREHHMGKLRRSLTEGDLRALDHGADLNQVVNAHRGMTTAAGPRRQLRVTTEGTTRRGLAGQRLIAEHGTRVLSTHQRLTSHGVTTVHVRGARSSRLTPAQIFEEAAIYHWDRAEIVRQLTRFGYLI